MNISQLITDETNSNVAYCLFKTGLRLARKIGDFLFFSYKTQVLYLLTKSPIVLLDLSPEWGVLLPQKDGQISLVSRDFIEVLVPSLDIGKKIRLEKRLWKLKDLRFPHLETSDNVDKILQSHIAILVQANYALEKELERLFSNQERIDEFDQQLSIENYQDWCTKFQSLYLRDIKTIAQIQSLQSI